MSLPKVDYDRIIKILQSKGLKFQRNDAGEIAVAFDEIVYYFSVREICIQILGVWNGQFNTPELIQEGIAFAHKLNTELAVPKSSLAIQKVDENKEVGILIFEVVMPTQKGMSDQQLDSLIGNVFSCVINASEKAEKAFPQLVTWKSKE